MTDSLHDLTLIKERLSKVTIIAPPEQAGIYQAMKDDIRTLVAMVEQQEDIIRAWCTTPGAA